LAAMICIIQTCGKKEISKFVDEAVLRPMSTCLFAMDNKVVFRTVGSLLALIPYHIFLQDNWDAFGSSFVKNMFRKFIDNDSVDDKYMSLTIFRSILQQKLLKKLVLELEAELKNVLHIVMGQQVESLVDFILLHELGKAHSKVETSEFHSYFCETLEKKFASEPLQISKHPILFHLLSCLLSANTDILGYFSDTFWSAVVQNAIKYGLYATNTLTQFVSLDILHTLVKINSGHLSISNLDIHNLSFLRNGLQSILDVFRTDDVNGNLKLENTFRFTRAPLSEIIGVECISSQFESLFEDFMPPKEVLAADNSLNSEIYHRFPNSFSVYKSRKRMTHGEAISWSIDAKLNATIHSYALKCMSELDNEVNEILPKGSISNVNWCGKYLSTMFVYNDNLDLRHELLWISLLNKVIQNSDQSIKNHIANSQSTLITVLVRLLNIEDLGVKKEVCG